MIWGGRGEAKGEWKERRKERGEGGREDRRRGWGDEEEEEEEEEEERRREGGRVKGRTELICSAVQTAISLDHLQRLLSV